MKPYESLWASAKWKVFMTQNPVWNKETLRQALHPQQDGVDLFL